MWLCGLTIVFVIAWSLVFDSWGCIIIIWLGRTSRYHLTLYCHIICLFSFIASSVILYVMLDASAWCFVCLLLVCADSVVLILSSQIYASLQSPSCTASLPQATSLKLQPVIQHPYHGFHTVIIDGYPHTVRMAEHRCSSIAIDL